MTQADLVLSRFGGEARMVALTGLPRSTVRAARKAGYFAEWHREPILRAAAAHDIPHTPLDYIAYLVAALQQPAPDHAPSDTGPSAYAGATHERVQ